MLELTIDFTDADNTVKYLQDGQRTVQARLKTALMASAMTMLKSIDTNFRVGGRPKWPALKATTIANRRKHTSNPLADTGRLKQSITTNAAVKDYGDSVGIGTNLEYARVHQYGHPGIRIPEIVPVRKKALRWMTPSGQVVFAKRVKAHTVVIPKRTFLLFQPEDITAIERIFSKHIEDSFKIKFNKGAQQ